MNYNIPSDRDGIFDPVIVLKCTKDISDIDQKVLSVYAIGMSQRDIVTTIEDIYDINISHETYLPSKDYKNLLQI